MVISMAIDIHKRIVVLSLTRVLYEAFFIYGSILSLRLLPTISISRVRILHLRHVLRDVFC